MRSLPLSPPPPLRRRPSAPAAATAVCLPGTYVHADYNVAKVSRLLSDHAGDVERMVLPEHCAVEGNCHAQADLITQSGFYILARTDAGYAKNVSVRQLLDAYDIESLRDYQHRSRKAINRQRQAASPAATLARVLRPTCVAWPASPAAVLRHLSTGAPPDVRIPPLPPHPPPARHLSTRAPPDERILPYSPRLPSPLLP